MRPGREGWQARAERVAAALVIGVLAVSGVTACDEGEPLRVDDAELDAALTQAAADRQLRSLLVRVTVDGEPRFERALGESIAGVRASLDMHFRNGAFGFTLMATLLMVLVDDGEVELDEPLSNWMPELPRADEVTLRDLAQMTSGYADYVYQQETIDAVRFDPYKRWTSDELIDIGVSAPMDFEPGTNWGYSHTNYVILGRVLEEVAGMPLDRALQRFVLVPMHTTGTTLPATAAIPDPVLQSYTSERRAALEIPTDVPFYEDSTFWDASWTTAPGAVGISTIADLTTIMEAVGTGQLVTQESFELQTGPSLVGFGHPDPNCGVCQENTPETYYSLGNVNRGQWLTQTKNFYGSGATAGYLAAGRIGLAVVATYQPAAFDDEGNLLEASDDASVQLFQQLAELLAPGSLAAAPAG